MSLRRSRIREARSWSSDGLGCDRSLGMLVVDPHQYMWLRLWVCCGPARTGGWVAQGRNLLATLTIETHLFGPGAGWSLRDHANTHQCANPNDLRAGCWFLRNPSTVRVCKHPTAHQLCTSTREACDPEGKSRAARRMYRVARGVTRSVQALGACTLRARVAQQRARPNGWGGSRRSGASHLFARAPQAALPTPRPTGVFSFV